MRDHLYSPDARPTQVPLWVPLEGPRWDLPCGPGESLEPPEQEPRGGCVVIVIDDDEPEEEGSGAIVIEL